MGAEVSAPDGSAAASAEGTGTAGEAAKAQASTGSKDKGNTDAKEQGKKADKPEEKQITFAKALTKKENRDTASVLVFFASALAITPIGGLLICEASLRHVVEDNNKRWMISGAVAVFLVNLLLVAYVLYCFREGFQHEWGAAARAADREKRESTAGDS